MRIDRSSSLSLVIPAFQFVIPAKAGIQRGGERQDRHQSWYESMSWTPIRDRPLRQPLIRHSRHPFANPASHFVIPAKAGIQRGGERGL